MLRFRITGGIGTGKTTVLNKLESMREELLKD